MKSVEIHPGAVERVKKFTITDPQLGFGKYMSPIMLQGVYDKGDWQRFDLLPYGPLQLDPCAKVLHYGQEIFEGMKVFRHPDDSLYMFRPEMNAQRFNLSAKRMAMPEMPVKDFLKACEVVSAYSKQLVPRRQGESLYLRPFMIATEVGLGIKPSKQFLFIVVASPSGNYFAADSVKVYIEREDIRCAPGGIGHAKTGGNYAASLQAYAKTLEAGCDQTLWLDAIEHKYIEEMSGMNFFAVIDETLYTPALTDTILNGVTRRSVIELAKMEKINVVEKRLSIDEVLEAMEKGRCDEAFVCGTAAVVVPIASLQEKTGEVRHFKLPQGQISLQLREKLLNIQSGQTKAPEGWLYPVETIQF